jgi:hypothetical protein
MVVGAVVWCMQVYEYIQRTVAQGWVQRPLSPLESSACGAAAAVVAQLGSTPLDVVRTRIMTDQEVGHEQPHRVFAREE